MQTPTVSRLIALMASFAIALPAAADDDDDRRGRSRGHDRHDHHDHHDYHDYHDHDYHHDAYQPRAVIIASPPARYRQPPPIQVIRRYPDYAPAPVFAPAPVYAVPQTIYANGPMVPQGEVVSQTVVCTNSYNPFGALLGGVAGGVLGSRVGKGSGRVAATIGGTMVGAVAGDSFGGRRQDCTTQFVQQQPLGVPMVWEDPYNDGYYEVTPTRTFTQNGRYCREYQSVVTVGSRPSEGYGTACRQPDGSWEIMN